MRRLQIEDAHRIQVQIFKVHINNEVEVNLPSTHLCFPSKQLQDSDPKFLSLG